MNELLAWLHEKKIHIAALQETKLTSKSKPSKTGEYTMIRKDRVHDSGGGLAFLIHASVQFTSLPDPPPDPHIESQAIKVNNTTITNIYIPPTSSCAPGYTPSITQYLTNGDAIVVGDLNAHDEHWYSSIRDARGSNISDEINGSNFGVLNENAPTRIPRNGQPTSPDLSLSSISLLATAVWETYKELGSDHLPIVISLPTNETIQWSQKRTYVNFAKAKWDKFQKETEDKFSALSIPTDVYQAEKKFRQIINNASKHNIPQGRIQNIIPSVPTEAAVKIKERNELRATNPTSDQIPVLNREIEGLTRKYRTDKWHEYISSFDGKTRVGKLFKAIKAVNGSTTSTPNQAINFHGKPVLKAKAISQLFNKQYSSVVTHKSNKEARKITRRIKQLSRHDAPTATAEQTMKAIKASKPSKALGPDGISALHLKHIGPEGIKYLTRTINLSLNQCKIPSIWKSSTIIPLPKPGKDPGESKSYRPVSLLCPSIKILERLLLPLLQKHLKIPAHQHGFRPLHSTVTALQDLNNSIADGFNKKKPAERTVLLQIDLSKAFDMVNHDKLLLKLLDSSLPDAVIRWFNCYLRGRQSRVMFRDCLSPSHNVRTGVPQGAVTSPLLFNYYLSDMPLPNQGVNIVQYADDVSIYSTGTDIPSLTEAINDYSPQLLDFLEERDLIVSPEKSSVTLFTPWTRQAMMKPEVHLSGKDVPLERHPKLLGVVHDTMYTFSEHAKRTITKAKQKVNALKALAGTDWGQSKEVIITAYKATCRSTLEYGAPIWSNIMSKTHKNNMAVVENSALRVATGCHKMASSDHIHEETKVIPLTKHTDLLCKQFLLGCHREDHPGYKHVNTHPPGRCMKHTVHFWEDEVGPIVNRLTTDEVLTQSGYKTGLKYLHTETVKKAIDGYEPNRVLQHRPPKINPSEMELPRQARRTLSQLRSGWCQKLNSFHHKIDPTHLNECPESTARGDGTLEVCGESPHDVKHLFKCKMKPTDLKPEDLWLRPKEMNDFLNQQH